MLSVADANTKVVKQYDYMYFKDIVNAIFETSDRGRADALVEEYDSYWKDIPGTRGYIGKNTVNASTYADKHIEFEGNLTMEKIVKEETRPIADAHIEFEGNLTIDEIVKEPTKPILNNSLFEF